MCENGTASSDLLSGFWYKPNGRENKIEEVEVIRESKTRILIKVNALHGHQRWEKKESRNGVYFRTKAEAISFIRKNLKDTINHYERSAKLAQEALADFDERNR